MTAILNPGKFRHKIKVYRITAAKDANGIKVPTRTLLLETKAQVRNLRGYTLITNNTDFEKAYTNFNIRMPKTALSRKDEIEWKGQVFKIEYLNDIDSKGNELEIQAKEVTIDG